MNASFVASFDKELDVRVHERDGHSDVATVGKYKLRVIPELFNKTEHVVLQLVFEIMESLRW